MEEQHRKIQIIVVGKKMFSRPICNISEDVNQQTVQFNFLQFLDFGFLITSLLSSIFSHKSTTVQMAVRRQRYEWQSEDNGTNGSQKTTVQMAVRRQRYKWQSEDTVKVNKIPETKHLKHEIKR